MHKTYEEIKELAVKVFGEDVEISYNSQEGWTIQTQIEESPFSWDGLEDTPAYKAEHENYCGETFLERWGRKNGYGWCSMRELVSAYNEAMEKDFENYLKTCREFLERQGVEVPENTVELMAKAQEELDKLVANGLE